MNKPLIITRHAREAMMMRRINIDAVIDTLQHPEVTDTDRDRNKRFFREQICVVVVEERDRLIVKTVLFRIADKWTDTDVRLRPNK